MTTTTIRLRFALACAMTFVLLSLGCSEGAAAPDEEPLGAAADPSRSRAKQVVKQAPKPADTADRAALTVARGLVDGRPEVAWQALPASYQRDVTTLIHEAAESSDAELWNRTFRVLGKLTVMLSEKRTFILEHPALAQKIEDREQAEASWDAVVGLLDVLAHSELSDLDRMRTLDVEAFLADTGAAMMQRMAKASALTPEDNWAEAMAELRATEATLVSSEGDRAVVRIETPDEPAHEDAYVRVEGKWIPQELADDWSTKMAKAREQLAKLSTEEMEQNKQAVMMQLGMVEGAIDSLMTAETAEEFNAGIGAFVGMAMGAIMSQAARAMPEPVREPSGGADEPADSATSDPVRIGNIARQPVPQAPGKGGAVPVELAADHVGRSVRIVTRDGRETTGKLSSVDGTTLTLEREVGGGTMAMQFDVSEVESLSIAG